LRAAVWRLDFCVHAYIGRGSDERPYKGALDVLADAPHRSLRELVAFEATQRVRSPCAVTRYVSALATASPIIAATCRGSHCWTRLGPYEITAQIGVGGMGEVWCATDTNLGRQVAIKILPDAFAHDPERLARFEREAKTLASLNHPEHRADLRLGEDRQYPCARDGTGRGADARRPNWTRPNSHRRGTGDREADRRSARGRTRAGDHPSRSEAA